MAETLSGQSRKTKAIIVDEENSARELTAVRETPDEKETGDAEREKRVAWIDAGAKAKVVTNSGILHLIPALLKKLHLSPAAFGLGIRYGSGERAPGGSFRRIRYYVKRF